MITRDIRLIKRLEEATEAMETVGEEEPACMAIDLDSETDSDEDTPRPRKINLPQLSLPLHRLALAGKQPANTHPPDTSTKPL